MTSTEMETLLKNLDTRLARVEHILPTLATKDDLALLRHELARHTDRSVSDLRQELGGQIERSANGLRALLEDARSETHMLAEHVLDLLSRFPRS